MCPKRLSLSSGIAICGAFLLVGCVTERSDGSQKVETTTEANREGIKGAAKSPLRDLNVLRTKIPETLLQAMADPYSQPATGRCPELLVLVAPLDEALGPDLDKPKEEDGLKTKSRNTALDLAAGAASDVIPFRGWIRKLSGAERHDRLVQGAIIAGAVRRSYLKGLGEAKGCPSPATPSHELAGAPVLDQSTKPKYPIH